MAQDRVLVTGATGFLGGALARRLVRDGFEVTGTGRAQTAGSALERDGVRFVTADIADTGAMNELCARQDYVFHVAALASPWGRREEFFRANVTGTKNVVRASRAAGVRRLIHISTPSIYMDARHRTDISEADALPAKPLSLYAETKLLAEQVVDAEHARGLATVTLRPQVIFGPGDPTIFPRVIRLARRGVLPVIGNGRNLVDITYIDNVVDAMLLAMRAPDRALGRKYNITNGEPTPLYEVLDRVLRELGISYRKPHISSRIAWGLAAGMEWFHRLALPAKEPVLTRYAVAVFAFSRTLCIDAARRDLGYAPRVSLSEGIERYVSWWRESEATSSTS